MTNPSTFKAEFACEMSCDACKSKIETLLGPLQGVQVLKIDVTSQRVLLELSNTSQTVNELQSLIEQKTGIKTVVKGFGSELAAVAEIQGQSNIIGVVRMAQLTGNTCLVDGVIDGLFKSNGHSYSLNIHKFGDLSKPTLENVGPVFIPISKQLKETSENRASFKVELPNCDLSGCIGRSMAIGDNHSKQLLAAGIVARASPVGSNVKKVCLCSGKTLWEEREIAQQSSDNVIIYDEDDIVVKTSNSDSLFDVRLKEKWLSAQTKNVFRYVLTEGSVESKIIDGSYKFVAEFNANRGLLRRKPQNAIAVKMPFNGNNFNFTKVSADETLFKFRIGSDGEVVSILINNSPIEFASSLMVPSVEKCLPQVLTEESIFYAIFLSSLSSHNSFRMGFNSLGAAASVNQLHWHLYYLDFDLEIESTLIVDNQLLNWPAAGFAFEIEEFNLSSFREVATKVFKIVDYCFEIELPHNLFITRTRDGSRLRILLWPREAEFGVKNDMEITAALCEFSGFFICKTREMYDTITEEFCLKAISSLDSKIELLSEKFSHL